MCIPMSLPTIPDMHGFVRATARMAAIQVGYDPDDAIQDCWEVLLTRQYIVDWDNPGVKSYIRQMMHTTICRKAAEEKRYVELPTYGVGKDMDLRHLDYPAVHSLLTYLKPNEKQAVCYRFGLQDGTERTLDEVGALMGVTGERVRQLLLTSMRRLRNQYRRKQLMECV